MIVKGLIKTIDFSDNSCRVRLPIFETTASQGEVVLKAVFLTQPGMYNGYAEGDIVFVDFENDKLNQPVILGKLYLGVTNEDTPTLKGGLTVSNLTVSTSAKLPIDTTLVLDKTSTEVSVENGITSYKSITDIIKALYKTEASVGDLSKDQSETVASIKVEYLSHPVTADPPTADHPGWQIATPTYKDTYAIWQKTTCYNHRGQILNVEIICISAISSSIVYKLRCSTRVHAGPNQTEAVKITAWAKFGTELSVEDETARLWYKWDKDEEFIETGSHTLTLTAEELQSKNLIIVAKHEDDVYEDETIMYNPLNTPVVILSNDTDVILYTADGSNKLGDDVSTTATLYLNGDILDATYSWAWDDTKCTCEYPTEIDAEGTPIPLTNTIRVTGVNSETRIGVVSCTATVTKEGAFLNKTYTKDFTVTQTRVGENATSYWLASSCTVHTGAKHGSDISLTAMKQFGVFAEDADTSACLWWKFATDESWCTFDAEEPTKYRKIFTFPSEIREEALLVLATHNFEFDPNTSENLILDRNVYLREEIPFSPLNSPMLNLTKDSAAILYTSDGVKANKDDIATTTAELYLNGTKILENVKYTWNLQDCTGPSGETAVEGDTVSIKDLATNSATATCTATYKGEPYTKTFTVVRQVQGISIQSQTTYYALIAPDLEGEILKPSNEFRVQILPTPDGEARDLAVETEVLGALDGDTITNKWSLLPPAHTVSTTELGWKYWTTVQTIYSTGTVTYSPPIINEDLSGVYEIAQGKTTNYYGALIPTANVLKALEKDTDGKDIYIYKPRLKVDDCWFDTGYYPITSEELATLDLTSKYINYYVGDGSTKTRVTAANHTTLGITPKSTPAYVTGGLKQCTALDKGVATWSDIGNEIVANKLTANYINALDITAQKIEIKTGNDTLFKADGLSNTHTVKIAGFDVSADGLFTTDFGTSYSEAGEAGKTDSGVYVGKDGIKLGKNFSVDQFGNVLASSLKISSSQTIGEALGEVATNAQTNLENALKDPATAGDTTLGSTWLSTTSVYAQNLHVANADITNQILVGSKDSPILYANVNDSENVKIGGFKVSSTQIRNGNDLILSTTDLSSKQTVASHSSKDWRLTIGTKFGVKDDGVLYADGAKFINEVSPITSGGGTLGSDAYRWGNIYGANINAKGTLVSKDAQDKVLFSTDMNGNTVLTGQLYAHGQIVTDAQVFSSGAIISYNPTTDTTKNGNTVTVNPRILLNPDGAGQIRCRGGVYVYADDKSITGALDPADPMWTLGSGPWPMFAVDNKGEVWAKKVHFSQGGSLFYEPVISVADGNSNSVYTTMVDIATDVTGGSVIYAQWKSIRLPSAFQMTNPHATNDKVKGVFLTGFLSDSHVDTSTTVSGDCGSTSTETGTALNIGAQGMTHYVRWDANHVYVLIPKKITIDSTITSTFDIKLCLLIVGNIAK